MLNQLYKRMVKFYEGDPNRIQHFVKVHSFAKLIGQEEGLDEKTLFTLEAAAFVHDIGIKPAEEKYGSCEGPLQEKEGPAFAREMLSDLGFEADVIERVCYLVGHHHTYTNMDGLDYQILVEADFLVNDYEGGLKKENIVRNVQKIFRTETGKEIAKTMFMLNDI